MSARPNLIRCRHTRDGRLVYAVACRPDALLPVRARDLDAAWDAAREAAAGGVYGPVRQFRFGGAQVGPSGIDLLLGDADACCWAAAVDAIRPLTQPEGLSLLLRLLGLIDAIARWAAPLCRFARDGAELHPMLLEAAALTPLTPEGRLAENSLRAHLAILPQARPSGGAPARDRKPCASSTPPLSC